MSGGNVIHVRFGDTSSAETDPLYALGYPLSETSAEAVSSLRSLLDEKGLGHCVLSTPNLLAELLGPGTISQLRAKTPYFDRAEAGASFVRHMGYERAPRGIIEAIWVAKSDFGNDGSDYGILCGVASELDNLQLQKFLEKYRIGCPLSALSLRVAAGLPKEVAVEGKHHLSRLWRGSGMGIGEDPLARCPVLGFEPLAFRFTE